ncbi:MAG: Peptidase S1C, Do [Parcubacteria group bacterium GW2011_GWA2_45_30]|nr:MAG: Peptidase S1C, Do [Parcubacteria group bacterium GW2011_GWA2_45_30]
MFFSVLLPSYAVEAQNRCVDIVCENMQEAANLPFVVSISTAGPHGSGTGFVGEFGGKKYIVTNNHVVDAAIKVWVKRGKDSFWVETEKISRDRAADVALLSLPKEFENIPTAVLDERVAIGQQVYAIGDPFGMRSVTEGRITATDVWILQMYILTQTPLNPGNSGGPMINGDKKVVGIATAIISGANNVAFALPVQYLVKLFPRLVAEKIVRHATTDFMYFNASSVPPLFFEAQGLEYPPTQNRILVLSQSQNPNVDIRPGDTILKMNDSVITDAWTLEREIFFRYKPGEEVELTLMRNGQSLKRKIILSEFVIQYAPREGKGKEKE